MRALNQESDPMSGLVDILQLTGNFLLPCSKINPFPFTPTCRDDSALPTAVRPHHRVGKRLSPTRRAADWPVVVSDVLSSTTLCKHLFFGLTGPEIRHGHLWLTQRFTPLFGFVHGSNSVALPDALRGLPEQPPRFTRGGEALFIQARADYWLTLFASPQPSEQEPAASMSSRTTDFYMLSTAVWPWKTVILQAFLSSLSTAARNFTAPSFTTAAPLHPALFIFPFRSPSGSSAMDATDNRAHAHDEKELLDYKPQEPDDTAAIAAAAAAADAAVSKAAAAAAPAAAAVPDAAAAAAASAVPETAMATTEAAAASPAAAIADVPAPETSAAAVAAAAAPSTSAEGDGSGPSRCRHAAMTASPPSSPASSPPPSPTVA
ncbi:unnamed protein product, partial [Pylaiella littoralis]